MKAQIVSLHCVMKNRLGRVISSSYCQEVITAVAGSGPLPGLAKGLVDLKKGETRSISLAAHEAYGFYDPKLVLEVGREEFGAGARLGQLHSIRDEGGAKREYRIARIDGERITLDANHPLAGQDLIFEVKALSARDATPEEIREASEDDSLSDTSTVYAN